MSRKRILNEEEIATAFNLYIASKFSTKKEAANYYGISSQNISNIIHGHQHPSFEMLLSMGYEKVKTTTFRKVK